MERNVRAKAPGIDPSGKHVRQGESFTVDETAFAPSWMDPVGWAPPEPPKAMAVADALAAKDARIAELTEQVSAEQARTAQVVEKAQAAIEARDAQIAEMKASLEEALKPKPDPEPPKTEPEPPKTAAKTK